MERNKLQRWEVEYIRDMLFNFCDDTAVCGTLAVYAYNAREAEIIADTQLSDHCIEHMIIQGKRNYGKIY